MTKIKAVLFDLDNTLLGNGMARFLPAYFDMLGEHMATIMPKKQFLDVLLKSTEVMVASSHTAVANHTIFWADFYHRTGIQRASIEPHINHFYIQKFPTLQTVTNTLPQAPLLIQACTKNNLTIVIATNPLFPRIAIEERLRWAGIPADHHPYALVTTYENMHATKPHPTYYEEILTTINVTPQEAIMIGDDWKNDIIPASTIGLYTYWITPNAQMPPTPSLATAHGSIEHLTHLITTTDWLQQIS